MSRRGENIYKRKDGRWEGRYIKSHDNGKIHYGYVYGKTYREVKQKIIGSSQNAVGSVMQSMPELPSGTFGATALEWLAVSRNQLKESSYALAHLCGLRLIPFTTPSYSMKRRTVIPQKCG